MRIYRDSTIEDLKGLATQIERFGGSCSPIVQTLLREAKKSILGGKLSEAAKTYRQVAKTNLAGMDAAKVLASGLIRRLSESKPVTTSKSISILCAEYHNALMEKYKSQYDKLKKIIEESSNILEVNNAETKLETLNKAILSKVNQKRVDLTGNRDAFKGEELREFKQFAEPLPSYRAKSIRSNTSLNQNEHLKDIVEAFKQSDQIAERYNALHTIVCDQLKKLLDNDEYSESSKNDLVSKIKDLMKYSKQVCEIRRTIHSSLYDYSLYSLKDSDIQFNKDSVLSEVLKLQSISIAVNGLLGNFYRSRFSIRKYTLGTIKKKIENGLREFIRELDYEIHDDRDVLNACKQLFHVIATNNKTNTIEEDIKNNALNLSASNESFLIYLSKVKRLYNTINVFRGFEPNIGYRDNSFDETGFAKLKSMLKRVKSVLELPSDLIKQKEFTTSGGIQTVRGLKTRINNIVREFESIIEYAETSKVKTDSGDRYPLSSYKVSEFRRALESFLKVLNGIYYKMKY